MTTDKNGWVQVHRKLLDSKVFLNPDMLKIWMWCLLKASHKDQWFEVRTGRGITEVHLSPGQFIFGRNVAAKELNMPASSVYKKMQKLKTMKKVDIQRGTHYSIITIINWERYQKKEEKENRQCSRQGTGKEQASSTYNNVNNVKNKKTNIQSLKNTFAPDTFEVTEQMKLYAKSKKHTGDLEDLTEGFLLYHRKKGSKFKDWYAAWQTWLRNDLKFNPPKNEPPSLKEITQEDMENGIY